MIEDRFRGSGWRMQRSGSAAVAVASPPIVVDARRVTDQLHRWTPNKACGAKGAGAAGGPQRTEVIRACLGRPTTSGFADVLERLTPKVQGLPELWKRKRRATGNSATDDHPGVDRLTALAFELVIGTPERFHCGKQIASYVGLVPSEESSGDRRRLGTSANRATRCCALAGGAAGFTVRVNPVGSEPPPRHAARQEDRQ